MSAYLDQEQANLLEQVLDPKGLYQAKRNEAFLCLATGSLGFQKLKGVISPQFMTDLRNKFRF